MNFFKISPEAAAQAQCLARLHTEARAQARRLRAQAIDDFWRCANELLCRNFIDTIASMYSRTYARASRSAKWLGSALARQRAR